MVVFEVDKTRVQSIRIFNYVLVEGSILASTYFYVYTMARNWENLVSLKT